MLRAQEANCVLGYTQSRTASRVNEEILPFETSPEKAPRGNLTAAFQYLKEPRRNLERDFA